MISIEEAAQGFAAVGSEPRLAVVLTLVKAGRDGLAIGEIQERLNIPASTLAHHIKFLTAAGLIEQEKQGRTVINRAAFERLELLGEFLLQECCTDTQTNHSNCRENKPRRANNERFRITPIKGS